MLKENFNKIKAALGNKNKASAFGQIVGILGILFIVILAIGALLIFGLNLMGLNFDYTFKTCLGAALVVFMIRPTSSKE